MHAFTYGQGLVRHIIQLNCFNTFLDSNVWSQTVSIPKDKDIPYRYLICTVDPNTGHTHVKRWETHMKPRKISAYHDDIIENSVASNSLINGDIDTFGDINGVEKIDRGWLTTETILQFKFIRNPFVLKQKLKNRLLYVKVSAIFI